jgi:hypothetical protein
MRPLGFSTGAIAPSDVRRALSILHEMPISAIELSAIRVHELKPMMAIINELDLSRYVYISVHAPSRFGPKQEAWIFQLLYEAKNKWPVVVHPDTLYDLSLWRLLGNRLCVENMDQRKPIGRTVRELDDCFAQLPEASFCLDLGHARQIDPSMTETYLMLKHFGARLAQIHVSDVNSSSEHDPLSFMSILDFQEIASTIPENVPAIIESIVPAEQIISEMDRVKRALARKTSVAA